MAAKYVLQVVVENNEWLAALRCSEPEALQRNSEALYKLGFSTTQRGHFVLRDLKINTSGEVHLSPEVRSFLGRNMRVELLGEGIKPWVVVKSDATPMRFTQYHQQPGGRPVVLVHNNMLPVRHLQELKAAGFRVSSKGLVYLCHPEGRGFNSHTEMASHLAVASRRFLELTGQAPSAAMMTFSTTPEINNQALPVTSAAFEISEFEVTHAPVQADTVESLLSEAEQSLAPLAEPAVLDKIKSSTLEENLSATEQLLNEAKERMARFQMDHPPVIEEPATPVEQSSPETQETTEAATKQANEVFEEEAPAPVESAEASPASESGATGVRVPEFMELAVAGRQALGGENATGTVLLLNDWHVNIGGYPPITLTYDDGQLVEIASYVCDTDGLMFEQREIFHFNSFDEVVSATGNYPLVGEVMMTRQLLKKQASVISSYSQDALRKRKFAVLDTTSELEDAVQQAYKDAHRPGLNASTDDLPENSSGLSTAETILAIPKAEKSDVDSGLFIGTNLFGETVLAGEDDVHFVLVDGQRIYANPEDVDNRVFNSVRFLSISRQFTDPLAMAAITAGFRRAGETRGLANLLMSNNLSTSQVQAADAGESFVSSNEFVWDTIIPEGETDKAAIFTNFSHAIAEFIGTLVMRHGADYVISKFGDNKLSDAGIQIAAAGMAARQAASPDSPTPEAKPITSGPSVAAKLAFDAEHFANKIKSIYDYDIGTLKATGAGDLASTILLGQVIQSVADSSFLDGADITHLASLGEFIEMMEAAGTYPLTEEQQQEFIRAANAFSAIVDNEPVTITGQISGLDGIQQSEFEQPDLSSLPGLETAMGRAGYLLATSEEMSALTTTSYALIRDRAVCSAAVFVASPTGTSTARTKEGCRAIVFAEKVAGTEDMVLLKASAMFTPSGAVSVLSANTPKSVKAEHADEEMNRQGLLAVHNPGSLQSPVALEIDPKEAGVSVDDKAAFYRFAADQAYSYALALELPAGAIRSATMFVADSPDKLPALIFKTDSDVKVFVGTGLDKSNILVNGRHEQLAEHAKAGTGYFSAVAAGYTPGLTWSPNEGTTVEIGAVDVDGKALDLIVTDSLGVKGLPRTAMEGALFINSGLPCEPEPTTEVTYGGDTSERQSDNHPAGTGAEPVATGNDDILAGISAEQGAESGSSGQQVIGDFRDDRSGSSRGTHAETDRAGSNGNTGSPGGQADSHVPAGGDTEVRPEHAGRTDQLQLTDYQFNFQHAEESIGVRRHVEYGYFTEHVGTALFDKLPVELRADPYTGEVIIVADLNDKDPLFLLGHNAKGQKILADEHGVRSIFADGILLSETVAVKAGGRISVGSVSADYLVAAAVSPEKLTVMAPAHSASNTGPYAEALATLVAGAANTVIGKIELLDDGQILERILPTGKARDVVDEELSGTAIAELIADSDANSIVACFVRNGGLRNHVCRTELPMAGGLTAEENILQRACRAVKVRYENATIDENLMDAFNGYAVAFGHGGDEEQRIFGYRIFTELRDYIDAVDAGKSPKAPAIDVLVRRGTVYALASMNIVSGDCSIKKYSVRAEEAISMRHSAGFYLVGKSEAWPPTNLPLGLNSAELAEVPAVIAIRGSAIGCRLLDDSPAHVEADLLVDEATFYVEEAVSKTPKIAIEGEPIVADMFETGNAAAPDENFSISSGLASAMAVLAYVQRGARGQLYAAIRDIPVSEFLKVSAANEHLTSGQAAALLIQGTDVYNQALASADPLVLVSQQALNELEVLVPQVSGSISRAKAGELIYNACSALTFSFAGNGNDIRESILRSVTSAVELISGRFESLKQSSGSNTIQQIEALGRDADNLYAKVDAINASFREMAALPTVGWADSVVRAGAGSDLFSRARSLMQRIDENSPVSLTDYIDFINDNSERLGLARFDSAEMPAEVWADVEKVRESISAHLSSNVDELVQLSKTIDLGVGSHQWKVPTELVTHVNAVIASQGLMKSSVDVWPLSIVFNDPAYTKVFGGYTSKAIGINEDGSLSHFIEYDMAGNREFDGIDCDIDFVGDRCWYRGESFKPYEDKDFVYTNLSSTGVNLSRGKYAVSIGGIPEFMYTGDANNPVAEVPAAITPLIDWPGKGVAYLGSALKAFQDGAEGVSSEVAVYIDGKLTTCQLESVRESMIVIVDAGARRVLPNGKAFGLNEVESEELFAVISGSAPAAATPSITHFDQLRSDPANLIFKSIGDDTGLLVNYQTDLRPGEGRGQIIGRGFFKICTSRRPFVLQLNHEGGILPETIRNRFMDFKGRGPELRCASDLLGTDYFLTATQIMRSHSLREDLRDHGMDSILLVKPDGDDLLIQMYALDDMAIDGVFFPAKAMVNSDEILTHANFEATAQVLFGEASALGKTNDLINYLDTLGDAPNRIDRFNSTILMDRISDLAKGDKLDAVAAGINKRVGCESFGNFSREMLSVLHMYFRGNTPAQVSRWMALDGVSQSFFEQVNTDLVAAGGLGDLTLEDIFDAPDVDLSNRIPEPIQEALSSLLPAHKSNLASVFSCYTTPAMLDYIPEQVQAYAQSILQGMSAKATALPIFSDFVGPESNEANHAAQKTEAPVSVQMTTLLDEAQLQGENQSKPAKIDPSIGAKIADKIGQLVGKNGDTTSYLQKFPEVAALLEQHYVNFDHRSDNFFDTGFVKNVATAVEAFGRVQKDDAQLQDFLMLLSAQWGVSGKTSVFTGGDPLALSQIDVTSQQFAGVQVMAAAHLIKQMSDADLIDLEKDGDRNIVLGDRQRWSVKQLHNMGYGVKAFMTRAHQPPVLLFESASGIRSPYRLDAPADITPEIMRSLRKLQSEDLVKLEFFGGVSPSYGLALQAAMLTELGLRSARESVWAFSSEHENASNPEVPVQEKVVPVQEKNEQSATTRAAGSNGPVEEEFSGATDPVIDNTDEISGAGDYLDADDFNSTINSLSTGEISLFDRNIKAVRLLKELGGSDSKRIASAADRIVLAGYAGWGALSKAFRQPNGTYVAGWESRAKELESLLTAKELEAAKASTNTAFYTSPAIVGAMYRGLQRLGVKEGQTWLDAGCGSGNFLGGMPEEMVENSVRYGVERDPITAAIAKLVHGDKGDTRILCKSFQNVHFDKDEIDVSISNPPFGNIKVFDAIMPRFNNMSLHNYFACRSIEALRPGGVKAMVVSRYLMDATDDRARVQMASMANLLGAYRLPETAFDESGTEVVTDVLFFQRREQDLDFSAGDERPSWVDAVTKQLDLPDGSKLDITINDYFDTNPEFILGRLATTSSRFGMTFTVEEEEGMDWQKALHEAVYTLPEDIFTNTEVRAKKTTKVTNSHGEQLLFGGDVPGALIVKPIGTMVWREGVGLIRRRPDVRGEVSATIIKFKRQSTGKLKELTENDVERLKGMCNIREQLDKLIAIETTVDELSDLHVPERRTLNDLYNRFVKDFGFLNSRTNKSLMRDDPNWGRVSALEIYTAAITNKVAEAAGVEPVKEKATKAAIFSKRVSYPPKLVTSVSNLKDGVLVSLNQKGRIDLDYIGELAGVPVPEVISGLEGEIFFNVVENVWEYKDSYLAGDVKAKYRAAEAALSDNPLLASNMVHLRSVFPPDVPSDQVAMSFGATWIPSYVYADFINSLSGSSVNAEAVYIDVLGEWYFSGDDSNVLSDLLRVGRNSPFRILSKIASNAPMTITRQVEGGRTVVDREATETANQKAKKIRKDFELFLDQTPGLRDELAVIYNEKMNSWVNRPLTTPDNFEIPGMNPEIDPRGHQLNYTWASLMKQTYGAIHDTGSGKTYSQTLATMKAISVGLINKSLYTVPNHLIGQWTEAVKTLFPTVKLLTPGENGFSPANRSRLFGQIATGDYDITIIGDSQLKLLPIDHEMAEAIYNEEVHALDTALKMMKSHDDRLTIKRLEARKESLRAIYDKQMHDLTKNGGITWNQLGIDQLVVDELQRFKNLGFNTSMQVAGLGNTVGSQKAYDLFIKVRSVLRNGGRFNPLTATPVSNTIAELYTYQRYMMFDRLREMKIDRFDAWVNQFGNVETTYELDATGVNYKQVQRLATFKNMPELMSMYSSVSHIVTLDDIRADFLEQGKPWIFPEIKGGAPQNVVVPRTTLQAVYMDSIIERAQRVEAGLVEATEDNKLVITTDARKAAIDMRLIDEEFIDPEPNKLTASCDLIFDYYKAWDAAKGTQIVFCDFGIPKNAIKREQEALERLMEDMKSEDLDVVAKASTELAKYSADEILSIRSKNSFSVYEEIKTQLVAKGIPEAQIAFAHDATNDMQRALMFRRINDGDIRVIIGSTSKLGEGTNIQKRMVHLLNIDCPWRADQMIQRSGRIIRQGNIFLDQDPGFEVAITNMATESTYDARMYMLNKIKAIQMGQIKTGRVTDRVVDDITPESATAAEMAAAASGNPLLLREFSLKKKIKDKDAEYREAWSQRNSHSRGLAQARNNLATARSKAELAGKVAEEFSAYPSVMLVPDEKASRKSKEPKVREVPCVPFTTSEGRKLEAANTAGAYLLTELTKLLQDRKRNGNAAYKTFEIGRFGSLKLEFETDIFDSGFHLCAVTDNGVTLEQTSLIVVSETNSAAIAGRLVRLKTALAGIDTVADRLVATREMELAAQEARPEPADPEPLLEELQELENEHRAVMEQLTKGADYQTATKLDIEQAFEEIEGARGSNKSPAVEEAYIRAFDSLKTMYGRYRQLEEGQEFAEDQRPTVGRVQAIIKSVVNSVYLAQCKRNVDQNNSANVKVVHNGQQSVAVAVPDADNNSQPNSNEHTEEQSVDTATMSGPMA